MEVNTSEMMKQIKNEILDSNNYAKLEVIVNLEEDMPYAKFDCKNVGPEAIAYLICETKEIIKKLETMPGVKESESLFKLDEGYFILKNNDEGKEEIWK